MACLLSLLCDFFRLSREGDSSAVATNTVVGIFDFFCCRERKILCNSLYGRKRALVLCMVLASLFCVIVSVIPPSEDKGKECVCTLMKISFCILQAVGGEFGLGQTLDTSAPNCIIAGHTKTHKELYLEINKSSF